MIVSRMIFLCLSYLGNNCLLLELLSGKNRFDFVKIISECKILEEHNYMECLCLNISDDRNVLLDLIGRSSSKLDGNDDMQTQYQLTTHL